jgi:NAD(P)-dependent dehydrogenase (short-subunit alcohol dehydrogenase family)
MQRLEGRAAFVTGGGSGIGRGIALALASEGVDVAVADLDLASAEAVAHEVEGRGRKAIAIACDVTGETSLAEAARAASGAFGDLHVLSNNAGVMLPLRPIAETTIADWEYVFSVNFFGIVKSCQALLPALRAHGDEAHVVNTASMAGIGSMPELPLATYAASKHACVAYTEFLRAELAPAGIGASVLCPGMIESNLAATTARNRPDRFGGPLAAPPPGAAGPSKAHAPPGARVLSGEECGRIVVRGIRENRLHIVTHPEALRQVERRFELLRADFAAEADAQARAREEPE